MKGVILAGGLGKRLHPLTRVTNKHLLPVGSKPMIYYPLETLTKAGIKDILIVTGGEYAGQFMKLLGDGREFGLKSLYYAYQKAEGGIAEALALAEDFIKKEKFIVILGDNILQANIAPFVAEYDIQLTGAKILLKSVFNPSRFGVPVFNSKKQITEIEEKPETPQSRYAVIGVYMYDEKVFEIIDTLEYSDRGELEITDVNNWYIQEGTLTYNIIDGFWSDAGTFESLYQANELVGKEEADE